MALPLEDVRVLDFTIMMQGPVATQTLGDLGATIVKVERPVTAATRPDERYGLHGGYGRTKDDTTFVSSCFLAYNRNKKSITVDLKAEKGKEIIRRLIAVSDVLYQNFRPGVMERLGFGYEDCCKLNPSLIYASATGYGPEGPYVDRPGQDLLAQALGGFDVVNATADGRPLAVGFSPADLLGALYGSIGVLSALHYRQLTGKGQRVNVSLLDSTVAALAEIGVHYLNSGAEPHRGTPMHACGFIPPPYGVYKTKDGYLAMSGGRQIPALSRVLGIPNLEEDPRFSTYAQRDQNRVEMERMIEEALSQRTTGEWLGLMQKADLWVAPVQSLPAVFSDPQVQYNDMVVVTDSPVGPLKLLGLPYKLSETPARVRRAPPLLGEHTDEVLRSVGYGHEEIRELRQEGVI